VDHLPNSLTQLDIDGGFFNQPIDHLPPNLASLVLRDVTSFDQPLDHLPPKLVKFVIDAAVFNFGVDYLPNSLVELCIKGPLAQPFDHLPPSLSQLYWCRDEIISEMNFLVLLFFGVASIMVVNLFK